MKLDKRVRVYDEDLKYIDDYRKIAGLRNRADAVKAIINSKTGRKSLSGE